MRLRSCLNTCVGRVRGGADVVAGEGGVSQRPGWRVRAAAGRVFAVSSSLTFERLADAIDRAFGRRDFSHLHGFELADGRRIEFAGVDLGKAGWIDHETAKLGSSDARLGRAAAIIADSASLLLRRARDTPGTEPRIAEAKRKPTARVLSAGGSLQSRTWTTRGVLARAIEGTRGE
jgi:hypothetical protein